VRAFSFDGQAALAVETTPWPLSGTASSQGKSQAAFDPSEVSALRSWGRRRKWPSRASKRLITIRDTASGQMVGRLQGHAGLIQAY